MNARMYGQITTCVPNRDADRRRGSRFFKASVGWEDRHQDVIEEHFLCRKENEMGAAKHGMETD